MCGLVGCAGVLKEEHNSMFKTLLILDQVRGKDSTGVLKVDGEGNCATFRMMGTPEQFLFGQPPANIWNEGKLKDNTRVLLGHNRFATVGKIDIKGAHPFIVEHIVGAHNGTLNQLDLKELEDWEKFQTDSEALFHDIKTYGIETSWKKLGFDSAAALSYYNKKNSTLGFIRNHKRPLSFVPSAGGAVLFWASEPWMIDYAARLHGVKMGNRQELAIDTHKSVTFNKHGWPQIKKDKIEREYKKGNSFTNSQKSSVSGSGVTVYTRRGFESWNKGLVKLGSYSNGQNIGTIYTVARYFGKVNGVYDGGYLMTEDSNGHKYKVHFEEDDYKLVEIAREAKDTLISNGDMYVDDKQNSTIYNAIWQIHFSNVNLIIEDNGDIEEVTKESWESSDTIKKGCLWCGDKLSYEERDNVVVLGDEAIHKECKDACEDCFGHDYLGKYQ